MSVMGLSEDERFNVITLVAGILHLGNIQFVEDGNYAKIHKDEGKKKLEIIYFNAKIFENHHNPVMLVFIGKLSLSPII